MKSLLPLCLFLTLSANAANVYTCADVTQVGKTPWPATGACTPTAYVAAGPGLLVATASADFSVQSWKPSAAIALTDNVFTDTKNAAGNAWAPASGFTWALPALGTVTLSWTAPTVTWDDKPLTAAITGYQLYSAATGSPLSKNGVPLDKALTTYVVTGLAAGTYDFAITTLTAQGIEGDMSNVVTKAPTFPPQKPHAVVLR